VAAVEVDADTGRVSVRAYTVVEDCGPVINPLIVEGQIQVPWLRASARRSARSLSTTIWASS
jgi:CO/xanthine dehydrogenase Mo-binding subunit